MLRQLCTALLSLPIALGLSACGDSPAYTFGYSTNSYGYQGVPPPQPVYYGATLCPDGTYLPSGYYYTVPTCRPAYYTPIGSATYYFTSAPTYYVPPPRIQYYYSGPSRTYVIVAPRPGRDGVLTYSHRDGHRGYKQN